MPMNIDWTDETENGARFVETTDTPINGPWSLLAQSDGTEWDVTAPGLRKSASIYLRDIYPRGFSDGRLRSLVKRSHVNQSEGWSGFFIMSDRLGIGTLFDPGLNMYQISDEDATIKIFKITAGLKTQLLDTGVTTTLDQIYGFEVLWEYDPIPDRTLIEVRYGTNTDFSDLTLIGSYSDIGDSINSPHQFSQSEGIFFQTESSDDFVSYRYDTTSIFRIVTL